MALAFALLLLPCSAHSAERFDKTYYLGDLHRYPPALLDQALTHLLTAGINTISTPVAWSVAEPQPESYDFQPYAAAFDRVVARGLRLLLVLDASGRSILNPDHSLAGEFGVPNWVFQQFPEAASRDAMGGSGHNLDYFDPSHLPALSRFYKQAIDYFTTRYGSSILAFAPAVTHEIEIKYPQYAYRWHSYSDNAQRAFDAWLVQRGKKPAALPKMTYGNSLRKSRPAVEPLYSELMRFREHGLRRYACYLGELIRDQGGKAAAYFGQSLSPHDAIYALGIIEELVDCFDSITVDYNYYDGWNTELKADVLPLLVKYAQGLGYRHVAAGIYVERLYGQESALRSQDLNVVRETVQQLARMPLNGVEIGNLQVADLPLLSTLNLQAFASAPDVPDPAARFRVGLVASKWTFYQWIAEHSNDRNVILDSLLAAFRLLEDAPDFAVDVVGERGLLQGDLARYDALLLPHQTTFSQPALAALHSYHEAGGRLVQDVQFDAFAIDGRPKKSWGNDIFGIAGLSWQRKEQLFVHRQRRILLPRLRDVYFRYVLLAPAPGFRLLMPSLADPGVGMMLRGPRSLVFGFLPHMMIDLRSRAYWKAAFVDEIRRLIESPPDG